MSAKIRARLARIEKSLDPGVCTSCKGFGAVAWVWPGQEDDPLPTCSKCGLEAQTVVHVTFVECRPRDGAENFDNPP
ncbi:MAG: hypothetical protein ACI89L_002459 [Phycisphaerales bacterium]